MLERVHGAQWRDCLDQLRARLGDEQFEQAYAQGMALSPEQAFDLALGTAAPAYRPDVSTSPDPRGSVATPDAWTCLRSRRNEDKSDVTVTRW
jgi:hypothetical protein